MAFKFVQKVWTLLVIVTFCIIVREMILITRLQENTFSDNSIRPRNLETEETKKDSKEDSTDPLKDHLQMPSLQMSKWIVLDGLTSKCENVTAFTQNKEWGVIIVTDALSEIDGCKPHNCFQLAPDNFIHYLGHLSMTQLLETPSLISGYLLAISWGANLILDADCRFPVEDVSLSFRLQDKQMSGLYYNRTLLFNPFKHMGFRSTKPKRFGDDLGCRSLANGSRVCLTNTMNSEFYYVKDYGRISVRQGVMVSEKTCEQDLASDSSTENKLDARQSPVVLGSNTIALLNTGPTLFTGDALWWMFMPAGVAEDVFKLFRTLWLHALKRSSLVNIGFYSMSNSLRKDKNMQCSHSHFNNSKQTVSLDCTNNTVCPYDLDPIACSVKLAQNVMNCANNAGNSFHNVTRKLALLLAWMDDLLRLAVNKPAKVGFNSQVSNAFKIRYGFNKQDFGRMNSAQKKIIEQNVFANMSSMCPKAASTSIDDWKTPIIKDIVLVVVINYEFLFETLPYLEYIHRQVFKYILYCGPALDNFITYAKSIGVSYVTYIDGLTNSWYFMYECVTHAMKLRLPVRGYLQIGDDILLNTWNIIDLPRDHFWIPTTFSKRDLYKTKFVKNWVHWNSTRGRNATIKVFSELQKAASSSGSISSPAVHPSISAAEFRLFARRFLDNYKANIEMNFIVHRATDIFYVPEVLRQDYIIASELFRHHNSFIEMAVPVIHFGLTRKEKVVNLRGSSLWREDRDEPWTHFAAEKKYFIHPFKALSHLKMEEGREFFCKQFLPEYDKLWKK